MNVDPNPNLLGMLAPVLGPWFETDQTLAAPAVADLSVALTPTAEVAMYPPAAAVMRVLINNNRPTGLAHLRDVAGGDPFTPGVPVITLELVPETWLRLEQLARFLPSLVATPIGGIPTRTTVRTLALELPPPNSVTDLLNQLPSSPIEQWATQNEVPDTSDAQKLWVYGLTGINANDTRPMNRLLRPGVWNGLGSTRDEVATLLANRNYRLLAFDPAGQPVDPGAVAAWWNWLAITGVAPDAGQPNNLWAAGIVGAEQRTCGVANALTVHLVNPHEGPVHPAVLGRLNFGPGLSGGGAAVQTATPGNGAVSITPAGDAGVNLNPSPLLRVGPLPEGPYAAGALTLWAAAPPIARDYLRVGALSVERFLTGRNRAADKWQESPSTRTMAFAEALEAAWGPFNPAGEIGRAHV